MVGKIGFCERFAYFLHVRRYKYFDNSPRQVGKVLVRNVGPIEGEFHGEIVVHVATRLQISVKPTSDQTRDVILIRFLLIIYLLTNENILVWAKFSTHLITNKILFFE